MAVLVAAGRAARRGILFRDGDAIERAAAVTAVLFDKTGTLTVGRPTVARVISAPGREPADVLAVAATLERGSSHPLARAILEAASDAPLLAVRETHTEPGMGVRGRDASGGELRVGTRAFVEAGGASVLDEPRDLGTHAYVAAGGAWVGTIVLTDPLREDASQAVARLRRGGMRVGIVSGDREPVVRDVARLVGVQELHAQCSPAEKAEIVARARRDGEGVAFVGDGLNDGPALAAADLGVAVFGATDVAQAAAALTLRAGGLARLIEAVELARITRRVMRQNLLWALVYNLVAIPAAAVGMLSPAWAALSMAASSLSVVANSLRLRAR
jgi:P-type E1-E2 ATPase